MTEAQVRKMLKVQEAHEIRMLRLEKLVVAGTAVIGTIVALTTLLGWVLTNLDKIRQLLI